MASKVVIKGPFVKKHALDRARALGRKFSVRQRTLWLLVANATFLVFAKAGMTEAEATRRARELADEASLSKGKRDVSRQKHRNNWVFEKARTIVEEHAARRVGEVRKRIEEEMTEKTERVETLKPKKDWKTKIGAILFAVGILIAFAGAIFDGDPSTKPDFAKAAKAAGTIVDAVSGSDESDAEDSQTAEELPEPPEIENAFLESPFGIAGSIAAAAGAALGAAGLKKDSRSPDG